MSDNLKKKKKLTQNFTFQGRLTFPLQSNTNTPYLSSKIGASITSWEAAPKVVCKEKQPQNMCKSKDLVSVQI